MMILTCPNCATRFFVEREEIAAAGRRVRCGACATEWVAYRADENAEHPPAEETTAEPSAPDTLPEPSSEGGAAAAPVPAPEEVAPASEVATEAAPEDRDGGRLTADLEATPSPPLAIPDDVPAPEPIASPGETGAPIFAERAAPARARKSGRGLGAIILILLVLGLAVVAGVLYMRQQSSAPATPGALGMAAPLAVSG